MKLKKRYYYYISILVVFLISYILLTGSAFKSGQRLNQHHQAGIKSDGVIKINDAIFRTLGANKIESS